MSNVPSPEAEAASAREVPLFHLDVLDLNRVIDSYAEMKAVEAFEERMRKMHGENFLQKAKGLMGRAVHRMGRGAWVDAKKRQFTKQVMQGLRSGEYTEEFLRRHVEEADWGISTGSHLSHEVRDGGEVASDYVIAAIRGLCDSQKGKPDAQPKEIALTELRIALEMEYADLVLSEDQLEKAVARLHGACVGMDVENLDLKLRIFDIGGIESGKDQMRKTGFFSGSMDRLEKWIVGSRAPEGVKIALLGVTQNPTFAAVASALGTSVVRSAAVAGTVSLGAATFPGMLLPIGVGSLVGGGLAGIRAKRESRDRNVQRNRREALGFASDLNRPTAIRSAEEFRRPLAAYAEASIENREWLKKEAMSAALKYLVRMNMGRDRGVNLVAFEDDWFDETKTRRISASGQHVAIVRLIRALGQDLGIDLVANSLSQNWTDRRIGQEYSMLFTQIGADLDRDTRMAEKSERAYALRQGATFAAVGFGIGTVVGAVAHGIAEILNNGPSVVAPVTSHGVSGPVTHPVAATSHSAPVVPPPVPHYPDNLQPAKIVRGPWFDNGTPHRFEGTELGIHVDKNGVWNVKAMIGHTATSSTKHAHSLKVLKTLFESWKVQAVLTPKSGGESFVLPIRSDCTIDVPASLRNGFSNGSFYRLEIAQTQKLADGSIRINALATAKGTGKLVFEKIASEAPKVPPVPSMVPKPPVVEVPLAMSHVDAAWYGIPLGGTPYHELPERRSAEAQKAEESAPRERMRIEPILKEEAAVIEPVPTEEAPTVESVIDRIAEPAPEPITEPIPEEAAMSASSQQAPNWQAAEEEWFIPLFLRTNSAEVIDNAKESVSETLANPPAKKKKPKSAPAARKTGAVKSQTKKAVKKAVTPKPKRKSSKPSKEELPALTTRTIAAKDVRNIRGLLGAKGFAPEFLTVEGEVGIVEKVLEENEIEVVVFRIRGKKESTRTLQIDQFVRTVNKAVRTWKAESGK